MDGVAPLPSLPCMTQLIPTPLPPQASAAGHGGWAPAMGETLGREGLVVDVLAASGDVRVRFPSGKTYLFNPRVRFCFLGGRADDDTIGSVLT